MERERRCTARTVAQLEIEIDLLEDEARSTGLEDKREQMIRERTCSTAARTVCHAELGSKCKIPKTRRGDRALVTTHGALSQPSSKRFILISEARPSADRLQSESALDAELALKAGREKPAQGRKTQAKSRPVRRHSKRASRDAKLGVHGDVGTAG